MKVLLFVAIYLFSVGASYATTLVVDFEGIAQDDGVYLMGNPFVANDMEFSYFLPEFTNGVFGKDWGYGRNTNGSAIFGWCASTEYADCSDSYLSMQHAGGSLFALQSLDASNLALSGTAQDLEILGYFADNSTIQRSVDLTTNIWETIYFDSNWTGLQSVVISTSTYSWDIAIDNIVVTTIPIPAALLMFISALLSLGAAKRLLN